MMKEQLLHILDQSVCLTRKQMKEYLSGAMLPEEMHAAEVHLNTCPLCRLALEGFEEHTEEALQAIASLNSGFLKEHFDNISPQIHLNSMAPAASFSKTQSERRKSIAPIWQLASIAAGLLLLCAVVWAWKHRRAVEIPVSSLKMELLPAAIQNAVKQEPPMPLKPASASLVSDSISKQHIEAAHHDEAYVDAGFAVGKLAPEPSKPNQERSKKEANTTETSPKPTQAGAPSGNAAGMQHFQEIDRNNEEHQEPTAPANNASKPVTEPDTHSESYSKATVEKALSTYLQGMNSRDPETRYQFMILAAQCYDALGNRSQAELLLRTVINEAPGHERRAARRALRRLQ